MAGAPRLALLRDGTAVGRFSRRHHETHVVVVEPNGHAYTYVGPNGRASRHLTPTLLANHRDLVRPVVEFRNRYACCFPCHNLQGPYVHLAVGGVVPYGRRRRSRSSDALAVCWPQILTYSAKALWNEADRVFEIQSLDGSASVRLDAAGRIVHAKFLVQVASENSQGEDHGSHDFAWVEQTFPSTSPPPCFAPAVLLLCQALDTRRSGHDQFSVERDGISSHVLPRNSAIGARPSFRPLSDEPAWTGYNIDASLNKPEHTTSIETISRWIRGMSSSLDHLVVVERADTMDYLVSVRDSTVLILRQVDTSESARNLADCDRGFFRAFAPDGEVSHQFTAETIPLALELFEQDPDRTRSILLRACGLCEAASSCRQVIYQPSQQDQSDHSSVALLEDVSNDIGRFRAFSDGRVRVVFADRTILQITSGQFGDEYSFTYKGGSKGRCTSDSVSRTQASYVNAAVDFAQWAFASPEERFLRYQQQQEQQQLVARELHRIAVRTELNATKLGKTVSCHEVDSRGANSVIPAGRQEGVSQDAVLQVLQETQRHIAHVQALLHNEEVSQRD